MLSSKTKAASINDAFGDFLQLPCKTMLDIGRGTFYARNQEFLDFIENVFGRSGRAIMNHVEFELKEPSRDDLYPKSKAPTSSPQRTCFAISPTTSKRSSTLMWRSSRKAKKVIQSTTKRLLTIMKSSRAVQKSYQK